MNYAFRGSDADGTIEIWPTNEILPPRSLNNVKRFTTTFLVAECYRTTAEWTPGLFDDTAFSSFNPGVPYPRHGNGTLNWYFVDGHAISWRASTLLDPTAWHKAEIVPIGWTYYGPFTIFGP